MGASGGALLIVETMLAMLNWAVETGLISESPLKRNKKRPQGKDHQRYKRRALSADELCSRKRGGRPPRRGAVRVQGPFPPTPDTNLDPSLNLPHQSWGEGRQRGSLCPNSTEP